MYYWITARNDRGRNYIVGWKPTRSEADRYILENLHGRGAEVHELNTGNREKASQQIRYNLVRSQGFDDATRNFRHSTEVV